MLRERRKGLAEGDGRGARVTHGAEEIEAVGPGSKRRREEEVLKKKVKRGRHLRSEVVSSEQLLREEINLF